MRILKAFILTLTSFLAFGYAMSPTATVENGVLIGTTTNLPSASVVVNKFLGVPYALSPPERFEAPEAVSSSSALLNTTVWKPACYQQFSGSKDMQAMINRIFNRPAPEESEDCLYLNVYAPRPSNNSTIGKAVLFWIYGGAFQFGTASLPLYDGSHFAAFEDVIVVTHNYRTNVFGFPSSPEIPITGHNLGLLDQRLALEWVQKNIESFGGDPTKVTIFGESAGAFAVDSLVTSYSFNSTVPFRGAIMESGQASEFPAFNRTQMEIDTLEGGWYNLTTALDCPGNFSSNLTCIKNVPATTIKSIIEKGSLFFSPWADNVTFFSDPAQRRANGNIAKVPILEGTNANEARIAFAISSDNSSTGAGLSSSSLGEDTLSGTPPITSLPSIGDVFQLAAALADFNQAYPLGSLGLGSLQDVLAKFATEASFLCPQARHANASASIGVPTWRYFYNATFTNDAFGPLVGACHASEIAQVFSNYPVLNSTSQQRELSNFMRHAWATFAKDPENGPGWVGVGKGVNGNDLGVLGNVGNVVGSGVTVVNSETVDRNCGFLQDIAVGLQIVEATVETEN